MNKDWRDGPRRAVEAFNENARPDSEAARRKEAERAFSLTEVREDDPENWAQKKGRLRELLRPPSPPRDWRPGQEISRPVDKAAAMQLEREKTSLIDELTRYEEARRRD